jgi:hypothetical protein
LILGFLVIGLIMVLEAVGHILYFALEVKARAEFMFNQKPFLVKRVNAPFVFGEVKS